MTFKAPAPSYRQTWFVHCTRWAVALCAFWLTTLSPHAQAQTDGLGNGPNSPIHAFGQAFSPRAASVEQQLRMIFYRTADSSSVPGAASIYVNGAYHASLVTGGYSELCLPAGGVELGVKSVEIDRTVKDNLDTITVLPKTAGQSIYLRVQDIGNGRQLLQPIPVVEALKELQGVREQTHTISRVPTATECIASTAPVPAPAPVSPSGQNFTLAADALFSFARSDLQAISSAGRASLDALALRLRSEYSQFDRLNIIGHADPLGQPEPNERLAWERARTVREYLIRADLGLGAQDSVVSRVTSEGRGSREPVVLNCGLLATPTAIDCHAPNRRVVIQVNGVRR